MQSTETRLLEEWKANNDLLKFYEDLKQKRFAHFLSIQTAFLAVFGLLAKDAVGAPSMATLTAFTLIAIPPLFIAHFFARVDARSRAFIDTFNTRLLLLEMEWKRSFPDNHFWTYQDVFAVLSRKEPDRVANYAAARNLPEDPYRSLVQSKSAHASEHAIVRLFWYLWIILLVLATVVHAAWHMLNGSWAPV